MPTPTYTPLANITLGSSAASVSFSSISQGFRDLVLVAQINASAASYFYLRFNSDSGANYSNVNMAGDGGTTNSASGTHNHVLLNYFQSASTTETNNILTNVMDYSATDKHKSVLSRNNTATRVVEALASRWANTSPITSFAITPSTGNFASGSTFALYGIASA